MSGLLSSICITHIQLVTFMHLLASDVTYLKLVMWESKVICSCSWQKHIYKSETDPNSVLFYRQYKGGFPITLHYIWPKSLFYISFTVQYKSTVHIHDLLLFFCNKAQHYFIWSVVCFHAVSILKTTGWLICYRLSVKSTIGWPLVATITWIGC